MFLQQLIIFIENREGRLEGVLEVLKTENINIISMSLADTSEYGVLRMIVSDPAKAKETLKAQGFSAKLTPVLAVKISNQVGQLQSLLSKLCKADINIEYMYAMITKREEAVIILKTADLEKAAEILKESGVELITSHEL